ncbi:diaminopimelate epimerase [Scytonema sp. HK-05]|uniref:hypothetical protein n=1 Tax=Scytonema sp. HK-05 TaxID=1137095 RepID=UPI0009364208|nr:hypothetical protein [Scytonema sp. HK-05]OKH55614.1 hypothetical protein NIES2130_26295 [Scytonema sp. HK-05]BAY45778.1 diaminopimelate epimerase [Scytonema sp. HK-05]
MDFYKYHALGNDYIVIDPNKIDVSLSPDNIRLICHRNYGGLQLGKIQKEIMNHRWTLACVAEPARSDGEASAGDWRWGSPRVPQLPYRWTQINNYFIQWSCAI